MLLLKLNSSFHSLLSLLRPAKYVTWSNLASLGTYNRTTRLVTALPLNNQTIPSLAIPSRQDVEKRPHSLCVRVICFPYLGITETFYWSLKRSSWGSCKSNPGGKLRPAFYSARGLLGSAYFTKLNKFAKNYSCTVIKFRRESFRSSEACAGGPNVSCCYSEIVWPEINVRDG